MNFRKRGYRVDVRVQVSCLAIQDGQLAMIKKLNRKFKSAGMYIPPGGHVEFGEKLEEACIREVAEETGLIVDDLSFKGVVTFLREGYHAVCFFFLAERVEGELVTNEPDKQTCHWVNLEGIADNELVPGYHRDCLHAMLVEQRVINATVEWGPEHEAVWAIKG